MGSQMGCSRFSERLLLAERDGVDRRLATEVMTESQIGSPMLKLRAPLVLDLWNSKLARQAAGKPVARAPLVAPRCGARGSG
jgi:3-hydroxyisobutyrate dehydrogenase-like beta-hydroxyacid dehydrogenase